MPLDGMISIFLTVKDAGRPPEFLRLDALEAPLVCVEAGFGV